MSLAPGTRLGAYQVLALLGAGGMGEVYRARDTSLNRDVALKILPESFARDPDRLARFKREAQILASLNHPNIAIIHGLEQSDRVRALVLELVEGPTLADRIAHGPIPLDEALPIARQIAEALEAAHEHSIIHRDLKPANIKLRPDGVVKVLDFGLAKALDPAPTSDLSQAPTITSPAMTRMGVILGTAAYMSPEQAKGREADKRSDIWSFGCVLYEMLTGKRAFAEDDVTETLAAIVRGEPDWTALPVDTPAPISKLLRRSLVKDRRDRLPDIAVARLEINEVLAGPPPTVSPVHHRSRWVVVGIAAAVGIVLGAIVTGLWQQQHAGPSPAAFSAPVTQTAMELPETAPLALGTQIPEVGFDSPALALSPDGRRLAYVGQSSSSGTLLYLRDMTSFKVDAINGTDGAIHAFFSPDGRWLGFLTNDKVKKVSLDGGAPVTLSDAIQPVSATWIGDDVFFSENQGARLSRVAAAGGRATVVVDGTMATTNRWFSQVLPDGKSAFVTRRTGGISDDYADIGVLSLPDGEWKLLVQSGYDGRYVPSGHLLFGRAGSLFAVRFDVTRRVTLGEPVQVVSGASMESLFGQVHAAVSNNGLIAYVPGGERALGRLAWVDRGTHGIPSCTNACVWGRRPVAGRRAARGTRGRRHRLHLGLRPHARGGPKADGRRTQRLACLESRQPNLRVRRVAVHRSKKSLVAASGRR
jgi:serine/threonine-protein kinase